ncbi:MAG TPA: right-handed parallel beta-helix repeat-containing protein [Streptosporangiaceae bacterium]
MSKTSITATLALILLATGAVPAAACVPTHAYVNCGAATDGKGTQASPYNTLADVNRLSLMSGDSIDFKRGTTCQGVLSPSGSGDASEPVRIGAYGPGTALPVIDAGGAAASVKLANQHNIAVSDLALSGGQDGVDVTATDYGPMSGIGLRDLDISTVKDGIMLQSLGSASPSSLDNVTVAADRIHGISGDAISLTSNWCRRPDVAPDWHPSCTGAWDPGRGLRIRGNIMYDVGGDGVSVATTQGASVDQNWLEGFGGTGITLSDSTGATISANQVSGGHTVAGHAGTGYELGAATDHATLQGNLSHDNGGGFLLFQAAPAAPIGPVSVLGNMSVDDHGDGLTFTGGPVSDGTISGNTVYIGAGVAQEVADSSTDSPLDVQFSGNVVDAASGAGTVGWNLPNPGWVVRDNLLHGVPVPSGARSAVRTDPGFAAPGGEDPFGYRLLAGSPALGSGVPVPASAAFPLALAPVPANAPNVGAVQAAAGPAVVLTDTFDKDAVAAAPADWTVNGPAVVTPDPASFTGRSLSLSGVASASRAFGATGGDARIDLRLFAGQADKPADVQVLDTKGRQVAAFGLGDDGFVAYSSDGAVKQSAFRYPVAAWTTLSILLHPSTGTYTLTADGQPVGSGKLTARGGDPGRITISSPDAGASFAADDVMVSPACCPC